MMTMKLHRTCFVWLCLGLFVSTALCAENPLINEAIKASIQAEKSGDCKEAIRPLAKLGIAGDSVYLVQVRLGWLYYCASNHTASITHYTSAARIQPFAIEPLLGLLNAQQAAGKNDDALRTAQTILRQDANHYTALSRSAWLYFLKRDYQRAAAYYRKVLQRYPSDTEMMLGLAYSLKYSGDTKEAAKYFNAVLLLDPTNSRAQTGLNK